LEYRAVGKSGLRKGIRSLCEQNVPVNSEIPKLTLHIPIQLSWDLPISEGICSALNTTHGSWSSSAGIRFPVCHAIQLFEPHNRLHSPHIIGRIHQARFREALPPPWLLTTNQVSCFRRFFIFSGASLGLTSKGCPLKSLGFFPFLSSSGSSLGSIA